MDAHSQDTKSSQSAWLVRDDRLLAASLEHNVFALAELLQREPLSILRRLRDDRSYELLAKSGHDFDFAPGSEEETELLGLALSGVPLGHALLWCKGDDKRPTAKDLASMMSRGDLRPALHQARELGIWISSAEEVEDLAYLQEAMPEEILQAAIEDLLGQFQPPTPGVVRQFVEGMLPADTRGYTWYVEGRNSAQSSGTGKYFGGPARKSYARTSSKGRTSRRRKSYGRYKSSGKKQSSMHAYFS